MLNLQSVQPPKEGLKTQLVGLDRLRKEQEVSLILLITRT